MILYTARNLCGIKFNTIIFKIVLNRFRMCTRSHRIYTYCECCFVFSVDVKLTTDAFMLSECVSGQVIAWVCRPCICVRVKHRVHTHRSCLAVCVLALVLACTNKQPSRQNIQGKFDKHNNISSLSLSFFCVCLSLFLTLSNWWACASVRVGRFSSIDFALLLAGLLISYVCLYTHIHSLFLCALYTHIF